MFVDRYAASPSKRTLDFSWYPRTARSRALNHPGRHKDFFVYAYKRPTVSPSCLPYSCQSPNLHSTTAPKMSIFTQFETSVESPRSPWIPPELISLILTKLWDGPLSADERSASLKNIILVNHTWFTLVAPIASRDVHIFNWASAKFKAFAARIHTHPFRKDMSLSETNQSADALCRSLTFHVNGKATRNDLSKGPYARFYDGSALDSGIYGVLYWVN